MGHLILNSFPVEITPTTLILPFAEYDDWKASTIGRMQDYSEYSTYRYERSRVGETDDRPGKRVRLLLLSGPLPLADHQTHRVDLSVLPALGSHLIQRSLARYLASMIANFGAMRERIWNVR